MAQIGIILGSDSDLPKIKECFNILEEFGIEFEVLVSSAHRTPEQTVKWVSNARERGLKVIIAAAGGAAHLPGVVAAHTTLPVLGIPIESKIAGGLDSILSIIQMPAGIPVAAMPAGSAGGANAALFALNILSVTDSSVADKLKNYRSNMQSKIEAKNKELNSLGYKEYIRKLEGKS
jgi:phosphoribosylaminoimidazole carboxylase PurE protein